MASARFGCAAASPETALDGRRVLAAADCGDFRDLAGACRGGIWERGYHKSEMPICRSSCRGTLFPGTQNQKLGELHRDVGSAEFELPFDRPQILPQNVGAMPWFQLAGLQVQQDLDFPCFKCIAADVPSLD